MTLDKTEILDKFKKAAVVKNQALRKAGLNCSCGDCILATFTLAEIEYLILNDEQAPPKSLSVGDLIFNTKEEINQVIIEIDPVSKTIFVEDFVEVESKVSEAIN